MFIFLPDSPVKAKGLSLSEKRMAVQRLRENQTGIENKHLKSYQVKEAFRDVKLYLFFLLGVVGNVPNGGISNFGTLIIQGFGYSTLVTTLMQIPYGVIIAISILICVYLNDRFVNRRCIFILAFLVPNIIGAFGLCFSDAGNQAGRLVFYWLTGPYNAAFVMILSLQTANTSGHTKKVVTNAVLFLGYCTGNGKCDRPSVINYTFPFVVTRRPLSVFYRGTNNFIVRPTILSYLRFLGPWKLS